MKQFEDLKLLDFDNLKDFIFLENTNQINKWGIQRHSLPVWFTILSEEVGELAKEILEYTYNKSSRIKIHNESIQVATLALKIAEMIIKEAEE
jgi:NTP pyrophosphatase (non-canonical NTP hydrolase)